MSNVYKCLVVASMLICFCGVSMAETVQQPPADKGPGMMKRQRGVERRDPERRLALMKEKLSLTDAQVTNIRPIIVAEQGELDKLRGDNTLNRDQRRARLQELNKATAAKVREFLTPEQQQKYEAIRSKISDTRTKINDARSKARGSRTGAIPVGATPEKRLARLTEHLTLTKEQQDKIFPILQDEYAQLNALPGDDSYNSDQRRAKLLQITQETNARIKQVLTPEQQKMYKETREKIIDRRSQKKTGAERP